MAEIVHWKTGNGDVLNNDKLSQDRRAIAQILEGGQLRLIRSTYSVGSRRSATAASVLAKCRSIRKQSSKIIPVSWPILEADTASPRQRVYLVSSIVISSSLPPE
jgi:hypothetical protein